MTVDDWSGASTVAGLVPSIGDIGKAHEGTYVIRHLQPHLQLISKKMSNYFHKLRFCTLSSYIFISFPTSSFLDVR